MTRQVSQIQKLKTIQKLCNQSLFSSIEKQKLRLIERREASDYLINIRNLELLVSKGVYKTGVDTELIIDVCSRYKGNSFLEVGCGTGAIAISIAHNFNSGIAIDINQNAIDNTHKNLQYAKVSNVKVVKSNVFEKVTGKFDLIVCNPPYNEHESKDDIEKMFWDHRNTMKLTFFNHVRKYLNKNGRIVFGWADLSDLELDLPLRLAKNNGLEVVRMYSRPSNCSTFRFIAFEFKVV